MSFNLENMSKKYIYEKEENDDDDYEQKKKTYTKLLKNENKTYTKSKHLKHTEHGIHTVRVQ